MNLLTRKSILLVEDNRDDEELTLLALQENRLLNEIHVVRDGAEALDFLLAQGLYAHRNPRTLPQVVLLDLKLPKLSGLEVLQRMRSHPTLKLLPVVILTTSLEEKDIMESYDLGANSYIRKPVDFSNFLEAVRQLSLYWLVLNEAPRIF
ncbi:MAG TPA: response regulator [Oligoflexus sp.]|uniref:response regulator n=1 Tax=Oligoflexus sp. TaxID=1971216 RepID=UPI002D7F87BC|nr:response regulator [Oligoflexus sp.]HET9240219.1 response regulator [Oligoflexus sp.]